ncbi:NAD(P)-dependent oxidoreductase [Pseudooceanicola algae]|uniref:precorrin-2 dehydrogenase n=1 Tax=Pseudooceanicola algae TaxID=1537215 RepID=A0A418SF01_9RHOB|nr:NAD(P)-dependent oxidoreductase [Pseudooceanicola algae]QPM89333.1 Siroheme synthase [Pseudooceanicola algae]
MRHFPIFVNMTEARILLSGGGETALAKLRLLLKTPAAITVHAPDALPQLRALARDRRLTLVQVPLTADDLIGATLVYAADADPARDAATAAMARQAGVLCNVVDDLEASDFITPAMVDRAPLTVAIGTEGAAPMLARAVKRDLEERLPTGLADLARAAQAFRTRAEALPEGKPRRAFWSEWFGATGPAAQAQGRDLDRALETQLAQAMGKAASSGRITLTFTGSDDPELLTLKARKALDQADVILHDPEIAPGILELGRREARLVALSHPTVPPLHQILALEADNGAHVLYLAAEPVSKHLVMACRRSGLPLDLIPGIPAPHAAQWKETA